MLKPQQMETALATLIVREKGQPDRSFPLEGNECVIGRSNDAHLRLPNVSVSRFHTRLIQESNGWAFEDLQSQNGTVVNGKRAEKGALNSDDQLNLGKYTVIYMSDDSPGIWKGRTVETLSPYLADRLGDEDNTYELSPDMIRQMQAAARRVKGARIEDIASGRRWEPGDEPIGFGGRGGVPIQGILARMNAATLRWNGKRHVIKKTGWAALVVNDKKVNETALEDGDRLKIGGSEFEYMLS
jgi:pSer/pThr/pTyr-binding forkhead associated (FHA) protein